MTIVDNNGKNNKLISSRVLCLPHMCENSHINTRLLRANLGETQCALLGATEARDSLQVDPVQARVALGSLEVADGHVGFEPVHPLGHVAGLVHEGQAQASRSFVGVEGVPPAAVPGLWEGPVGGGGATSPPTTAVCQKKSYLRQRRS